MHTEEVHRLPYRLIQKRNSPWYIIIKSLNYRTRKNIKVARERLSNI